MKNKSPAGNVPGLLYLYLKDRLLLSNKRPPACKNGLITIIFAGVMSALRDIILTFLGNYKSYIRGSEITAFYYIVIEFMVRKFELVK